MLVAIILVTTGLTTASPAGSMTASASPSDCVVHLVYHYYTVPLTNSPSSNNGVWGNRCGYTMVACSAGTWTKGQWFRTASDQFLQVYQGTACISYGQPVEFGNVRVGCTNYSGGTKYAQCEENYNDPY